MRGDARVEHAAPLGALLYSVMSMTGVMLVDVVTALVAIVPLLFVAVPQPENGAAEEGTSVWRETADGFRYLRERHGHLRNWNHSVCANLHVDCRDL